MRIRIPLFLALAALAAGLAPAAFAQQLLYIHADHLNTPRLVTNGAGVAVWRWDQIEPFGDNLPNEDPDGNSTLGHMPLRFPGQYFDKETNLAYNYFRDYDPAIGRYVQSDPIGLEAGFNTYGYVNGRPLQQIDRMGLIGQECFATCMASVAIACAVPAIRYSMCATCLLLRLPPLIAACIGACVRNAYAVCIAAGTVGCTAACAAARCLI